MVDLFEILLDKISVIYRTKNNLDLNYEFAMLCRPCFLGEWEEEQFESLKIGGFRYNYVYKRLNQDNEKTDEGTIYIGIFQNNPAEGERSNRCKMKVEWNPQKVTPPQAFRNWMMREQLKMQYHKVQKCDIALDFKGLDLSHLRYNTIGDTMVYGSKTEKTYYLRPAAKHGRVKIYDKTKEREKVGETIPQTLRVEMTLHQPQFHEQNELLDKDWDYVEDICRMFGEVQLPTKFITRQDDLEEKYGKYDEIYMWALKHATPEEQDELLSLMGKNARTKYRAALMSGDYQPIQVDPMMFAEVVSRMLNDAIYMIPTEGGVRSDSQRISGGIPKKLHAQEASRDYYLGVRCEFEKAHSSDNWYSLSNPNARNLLRSDK